MPSYAARSAWPSSLVPRPRHPLLTYHGALAPAAKLRPLIAPLTEFEDLPGKESKAYKDQAPSPSKPRVKKTKYYRWAELIQRVFLTDVLLCPECEGQRRIISFIIDPIVIREVLIHLGLPTEAPPRAGPRAPPGLDSEYGI